MHLFLLESQIENKIINKKADILQQKVQLLEYESSRKYGHFNHKNASRYLDPSSQDTVSSLEDKETMYYGVYYLSSGKKDSH